jgi:hypothetical protein
MTQTPRRSATGITNQHRLQDPILLAVDEQLGEGVGRLRPLAPPAASALDAPSVNSSDGAFKDVALMPGHDRMLGGTEDGMRGPGGPRSARRSRTKGTAFYAVFRADRLTRGLLSPT